MKVWPFERKKKSLAAKKYVELDCEIYSYHFVSSNFVRCTLQDDHEEHLDQRYQICEI